MYYIVREQTDGYREYLNARRSHWVDSIGHATGYKSEKRAGQRMGKIYATVDLFLLWRDGNRQFRVNSNKGETEQ